MNVSENFSNDTYEAIPLFYGYFSTGWHMLMPQFIPGYVLSATKTLKLAAKGIFLIPAKILAQQSYTDNSSENKVYVCICILFSVPVVFLPSYSLIGHFDVLLAHFILASHRAA